jgi:hypothetical protein
VGIGVGAAVGATVGTRVGDTVGDAVGALVGAIVGIAVGASVGAAVGAGVVQAQLPLAVTKAWKAEQVPSLKMGKLPNKRAHPQLNAAVSGNIDTGKSGMSTGGRSPSVFCIVSPSPQGLQIIPPVGSIKLLPCVASSNLDWISSISQSGL